MRVSYLAQHAFIHSVELSDFIGSLKLAGSSSARVTNAVSGVWLSSELSEVIYALEKRA